MGAIVRVNMRVKSARKSWEDWKRKNEEEYRAKLTSCSFCGGNEYLGIHHKDGNKSNNSSENHVCLCNNCHFALHRKSLHVRYNSLYEPETVSITPEKTIDDLIQDKLKNYKWVKKRWVYSPHD